MKREFCTVERAIEALAAGQVLIVADSEDRENEGDFLVAAEHITAEVIHFMISVGRGQLCVPVSPEIGERLRLTPMVHDPSNLSVPRFAVPVDHRTCTTGVSPCERASTIQEMLDPRNGPEDFIRPGHIFPLVARAGGLLQRTGHTEAAVDMARLAGLAPAGVLCEICSGDGRHMALRDELFDIAAQYDLPLVTIDALVDFRRQAADQEQSLLEMVARMQQDVAPRGTPLPEPQPLFSC
jgi:3,4-dihydroxy 2-butanone 4-phosphate synthase/GTP cyclohydrolase II